MLTTDSATMRLKSLALLPSGVFTEPSPVSQELLSFPSQDLMHSRTARYTTIQSLSMQLLVVLELLLVLSLLSSLLSRVEALPRRRQRWKPTMRESDFCPTLNLDMVQATEHTPCCCSMRAEYFGRTTMKRQLLIF